MAGNLDAWEIHVALAGAAAAISAVLIIALRPILVRYALARPEARSSHTHPTPQGGGIAVVAATILVTAGALILFPRLFEDSRPLIGAMAAMLGLAIVGITDDVRPLGALPRLILQAAAVAVVLAMLPAEMRVVPALPWLLERAGLLLGTIWFVNLINFMDGIDWLTVAEVVPVTAALTVIGFAGGLPLGPTLVAIVLCGAMIGFAPFNRPVARIFLGDVGSLPIGLLLAWLLIMLAGSGHLVAALLLPFYYLADATITLLRRLLNGEPIMQAHRTHFYQRALDRGFSVTGVVARVFMTNMALAVLAVLTIIMPGRPIESAVTVVAIVLVGWLLVSFGWARNGSDPPRG
jgi:UDP-N-acetylmuramyl pentapeptide phosphotransferase/UDP-N-acetylglucosamine-1-phosphate transferase